ncbi:DUF4836 family protein [Chitinophaga horti]|uniref:DUF4836 family protein n=1 Tax=Chitinophaga horti TaxID=2920382 RepID=A0ABY6J051_9BACT|nr:DUF4836 family protein [Chitinophaga horti]UYQ92923.1 DUF4836 family protein [Chitinophaga horti]
MKKNLSKVLLAMGTAFVVLMSSCSKVPTQSKHIPKEAAFVLSIDGKQLHDKLVASGITMDKLFESIQGGDTTSEVAKGMKEIENSGIDLKSQVFIAMTPATGGKMTFNFVGKLDDAAKFEAFLKKNKSTVEIKAEGSDFKYAAIDEAVVGWNKDVIIGVAIQGSYGDESTSAAKVEVARLFKLKESESANSIDGFKKLMKEKADMSMFANIGALYGMEQSGAAAMMMGSLKKLYEGAYYTATANFENGKIEASMKTYPSEALAKIMKKYDWDGVDLSMLEKYPSANINGFALVNFDLRMIADIVKEAGMDGLVNMGLAQSGLTLDDILKAFKGEIVAVASDFKNVKKVSEWDSTYTYNSQEVKWLFALKVGEKAAFDKVMGSQFGQQMFTKQGDKYILKEEMAAMSKVAVSIDSKDIIVASDAALQAEYVAGKGKATVPAEVLSEAKGNPGAFWVDLEKILASAPLDEIGAPEVETELKSLFKDIRIISAKPNGGVSTSTFVLNFKNKEQNSLAQLINFGTKAAKVIKEKEAAQRAAWETEEDTTVAEDAVVDTAVAAPF